MKLYLGTIVIVILVLFNVLFIFKTANHESGSHIIAEDLIKTDTQAFIQPVSEVSYLPIFDTNIPSPVLDAKAAIVYDVNSGRYLYTKNIREKVPVASLTKILTAIITVEKLNFKDIITIPQEAIKVDGERQDLYLNERITVENLLKMMLIYSSNDAAYALANHGKLNGTDYLEEMNKRAVTLDMFSSYFKDVAGLNDEAYSNAEDMVKLVRELLNYPVLITIMSEKELDIKSVDGTNHHLKSTNKLLGEISGILAGKTGYTDDAKGCMILVVQVSENNDRIISIVLGSGGRFIDSQKLVEWVRQAYRWR